jgi:hypothetical protein
MTLRSGYGARRRLPAADPRQIRAFARATGRLAKTDALDAQIIALFAERIGPLARPMASPQAKKLGELAARRRQAFEMTGMEANRKRRRRPEVKKILRPKSLRSRAIMTRPSRLFSTFCAKPASSANASLLRPAWISHNDCIRFRWPPWRHGFRPWPHPDAAPQTADINQVKRPIKRGYRFFRVRPCDATCDRKIAPD